MEENVLPETVTQTFYLYAVDHGDGYRVHLTDMDMHLSHWILLGTHEVTVPVPQIDVVGRQIEALRAHQHQVRDEAQRQLEQLEEKIQSLRALEHQTEE